MIVHDTQCFMAERMKLINIKPFDHLPLVTAPGAVVDIIREAIAEAAAG